MINTLHIDLGRYLRSLRARTQPEEIGLNPQGRRRVPGLRREEVAALAGVSPTYYTRLEQSQQEHASVSVLRSIANALRLPPEDESYLLKIGTPPETQSTSRRPEQLSHYTSMLVNSLSNVAAIVFNYRCDILSWNAVYHRIFAPHLDPNAPHLLGERPNIIKLNFLDKQTRGIYRDRAAVHRSNVAFLRFVAADYRQDAWLAELIKELVANSGEFSELWRNSYGVETCTNGRVDLAHPTAGNMDLMYDSARLHDGNMIKFYYAESGTSSAAALARLTDRFAAAVR